MTVTADALLHQALALEPAERARLASGILTSLEDVPADAGDIERSWDEESRRRVEQLEAGNARTFDREEVLADLEALRATRRH